MDKENFRYNDHVNDCSESSTNSPPHVSRNPFLSPTSEDTFDASVFTSMFHTNVNSLSESFSDCSFDDASNGIATANRLNDASFVLEYQQLYNCYTLCLANLQESIKEVEALRQENKKLRIANIDLVHRLTSLSQAMIQNCVISSAQPSLSSINDSNHLKIGSSIRDSHVAKQVQNVSPTSVIQDNRFQKRFAEKASLPKSISVRSSGYLKMNQRAGSNGGLTSRTSTQTDTSASLGRSRGVRGAKKEAEALEVYNQGMLKTELCNKWQETGTCPYGNNCQFAHGILELRPVIRHPRYKTQVCRMVLAGKSCPYGHRCHFRHSLTSQDRILRSTFD
ncbi:hypothetical protein RJ639_015722 [Escallonia herrerae]|uniref:C3H1-type domain-containing protein n=1 Tax=Escallonia herrerae TaxID=1293975 RepID=A0AA88VCQ5_9ASTE|nr:hypothetical protein RJ639_015722 [Escallonia herrerae]